MRVLIKAAVFSILFLAISPRSHAQLVYELACPAGYSPAPAGGKSFDQVTGQWRANFCISDTGNGRMICQADGCGASGVTLQTNGVANSTQGILNVVNSTANAVGLSLTCSNPSGGVERCEIGGASYTGNAATATTATTAGTASAAPYSGITSGSNTAAKTEGSGGSISPLNAGQVAGSQFWAAGGIVAPVLTLNLAGGSLNATGISVRISYNTAAGESTAGSITSNNMTGCGGGACQIVVTAPTLPAWATSYTVYSCQGVGCTPLRQNASTACVAITTNCTINVAGAGAAPLTVSTAWVQPANTQATECTPSVIPSFFGQTNDGNFHTWGGIDSATTANGNTGIFEFCRKVAFDDFGTNSGAYQTFGEPIAFNNALVMINHLLGVQTSASNQDRGLAIHVQNPTNDSATRYAMEGLQVEVDNNCNGCTWNGSPDGEVTTASFQLLDSNTSNVTAPTTYGINIIRGQLTKAAAGSYSSSTIPYSIVNGIFNINNSTFSGVSPLAVGLNWHIAGSATGTFGGLYTAGLACQFNSGFNLTAGQHCLYMTGTPGGSNNFAVLNYSPNNLQWLLNGPVSVSALNTNQVAAMTIKASANVVGSITASQATMTAPTGASCSGGGASQFTYEVVGVDNNGGQVASSTVNTASNCTNPLTVGNPATISNTALATASTLPSFVRIDVYRVGGPMATGKIGSLTCVAASVSNSLSLNPSCSAAFVDTGLSATGSAPTNNNTGGVSAYNFMTLTNCAATGTAANPSVASCSAASAGAFSCDPAATGGTCVVNSTAVTANSEIFIQEDASLGTRLGVTCNTNTITPTGAPISARSPGTSFTLNLGTVTTNPECFSYHILN